MKKTKIFLNIYCFCDSRKTATLSTWPKVKKGGSKKVSASMLKSLVPRVLVSLNWISLSSAPWQDKSQRAELKYRKLHLNTRKKKKTVSLWGWSNTATGCRKRFWSLHSWRYSKSDGRRTWVVYYSWLCQL